MVRKKFVATSFGVRVDHYGRSGEQIYSEYLPNSSEIPSSATTPRRIRRLIAFGIGLLILVATVSVARQILTSA